MIPNQFNFSTSILDIINSGITFDYPSVLYILLLLVALVPFAAVRWRKSRESAAFFAAAAATAMKVAAGERLSILKQMRVRMLASDVLFILFAAFLVIALASPRWGYRMVPEFRRGIDIVLAFDLSRSMDIRDVQDIRDAELESGRSVSRIERAVGIARELVVAIGDDVRIGTAIGRGRGVLAVPLTYDSEVALSFLHSLDGTGITGRGTNLESIVDAAAASFQDTIPSRRVIILFTDGDELSGSFQQAAERARRVGIAVSAVALGSSEGGFVPVDTSADAPSGYLLSHEGIPITSARQSAALAAAAGRTGGIYIDGSSPDAAATLAAHIDSLDGQTRFMAQRREANPRWPLFVTAALLCLAGAKLSGFTIRRQRQPPRNTPRTVKGQPYAR